MPDYKKKKGIKVDVSRTTQQKRKNAAEIDEKKAAARRAEAAALKSMSEKRRGQKEYTKPSMSAPVPQPESTAPSEKPAPKQKPEVIAEDVNRSLLSETERIPERHHQPQRSEKEIKKSKPPVKRYSKRRPVVIDSGDGKRNFSVVDGRKLVKRNQRVTLVALAALLVVLLLVAAFSTPVGIIEFFQNSFAKSGSGNGYPILISADETVNVKSEYDVTTVVGETTMECFSKKGKLIYSRQHSFNNPAESRSVSRSVTYDRGGTGYMIDNLHKTLYTGNLDNAIYAAAIGRNGTTAFATTSVEYNSQLLVFDKNMNNVFNWYSADATLTAACVSDSGRKIAAATTTVSGGAYSSTVYIFSTKQSSPVATSVIAGSVVVSIERINSSTFLIICNNQVVVMDWDGTSKLVHKETGSLAFAKAVGSDIVIVDRNSSNSGDYVATVINSNQKTEAAVEVNMNVKDVVVSGKYIYFLTDNKIVPYSFDGTAMQPVDCDFSVSSLSAFDGGQVLEIGLGEIIGLSSPKPVG